MSVDPREHLILQRFDDLFRRRTRAPSAVKCENSYINPLFKIEWRSFNFCEFFIDMIDYAFRPVARAECPLGEFASAMQMAAQGATVYATDVNPKLLEALLYPLWDAGLSVGHQAVEPDEVLDLAQQDLSTATALLDLRLLRGDGKLVDRLLERAFGGRQRQCDRVQQFRRPTDGQRLRLAQ